MADLHTPHPNGQVHYEHTDVTPRGPLIFVLFLVVLVAATMAGLVGLFNFLASREQASKETDLPSAAVDQDSRPPEPRLEEIEDVEKGRFRLHPARAEEILAAQKKRLESSGQDDATGLKYIPIEDAINQIKLPFRAEPGKDGQSPMRGLPSKASAGRTNTGGQ
jgi:hypothetical protein